jgi:hypothetical protein
MVNGLVIPADAEKPVVEKDFNGLEDYQRVVGGYIEGVFLPQPKQTFFVNEEGKLRHFAVNWRATCYWWMNEPAARGLDRIVGNAVLLGSSRGKNTVTDLPADWVATVCSAGDFFVELMISEPSGWDRGRMTFATRWQRRPRRYSSYFEATVQGVAILDRWAIATDVRVVGI